MIFRWAITLGIVGFVCGFFGPMLLAPGANQGPMLGIFVTGPGGAVLGAVLGLAVIALGVTPATAARLLYAAATVMAACVLYFSLPASRYRADVIDGEIRQCIPPDRLRDQAVDRLNGLEVSRPSARPKSWGEAFDQALDKNRGVVIELRVFRVSSLYERETPWDRGVIEARPWVVADKGETFYANYAGADCGNYPIGVRSLFRATGQLGIWPPAFISEMLALKAVTPLPAEDAGLLRNIGGPP